MEKTISKAVGGTRGSEVVGSNPADPTTRQTDPATAKIFKTLWELKRSGYSEDTLRAKGHRLKYLAKHVNLEDPEAVLILGRMIKNDRNKGKMTITE